MFVTICRGKVYLVEYVGEQYICLNMSGNSTLVRICQGTVRLLEYVRERYTCQNVREWYVC
jgi:hypothetical protein